MGFVSWAVLGFNLCSKLRRIGLEVEASDGADKGIRVGVRVRLGVRVRVKARNSGRVRIKHKVWLGLG